jgi:hypothetical protein
MKTDLTGKPESACHAYLLKIWLEHDREIATQTWRFSLEDAHSGNRRGFTDLDSLLVYLQNLTEKRRGSAR